MHAIMPTTQSTSAGAMVDVFSASQPTTRLPRADLNSRARTAGERTTTATVHTAAASPTVWLSTYPRR